MTDRTTEYKATPTTDLKASTLDANDGRGGVETQYARAPLDPKNVKFIINETVIRQTIRTPLDIQKWRNAHIIADSRYYPNRTWLYDLYDDTCQLDGHMSGILFKRWETILNIPVSFKRSEKPDESFTDLIGSIPFRETVCKTILETRAWGISGLEFEPGKVFAPIKIPRKHIKPKWQVISFEQNGKEGISYVDAKNIFIIGDPEDLGFFLKCVPYIIYKRNAMGDWAQYIEIFGQPIRVMYYDAYDQQAKIELKKTLDESGGSLALMIPKGVEFDIKDGKVTNGDGKLQESFANFINQELSVIVLGNTETTTNGKTGTFGKSQVHAKQQDLVAASDLFYLQAWLNSPQFLQILKSYGYNVEGGRFEFDEQISVDYLEKLIDILDKLPEDLPLDDDFWYKTFRIPKPDNYKELKKALQDKQKALQGVDDIESDPKNQPAKKPNPKNQQKKSLRAKKVTLRSLVRMATDFFA